MLYSLGDGDSDSPIAARQRRGHRTGRHAAARGLTRATVTHIATDLLVWKLLRQDMQLDRVEAARIVTEMVGGPPSSIEHLPAPSGRLEAASSGARADSWCD